MFILKYRLLNIMNSLSPDHLYYIISLSLLKNLKLIPIRSIEEMAYICGVSKSSLSDYVRKIGFTNYKEFKKYALYETNEDTYMYKEGSINTAEYIDRFGLKDYLQQLYMDLKNVEQISKNQIDRLADCILSSKYVIVLGSVYSMTAALDFQYRLSTIDKYVFTSINDLYQLTLLNQATDLDYKKKDVLLIMFSNSGQLLYGEDGLLNDFNELKYDGYYNFNISLITSNLQAARDSMVDYPVEYTLNSQLQTHQYIFRVIGDLIFNSVKNKIKKGG